MKQGWNSDHWYIKWAMEQGFRWNRDYQYNREWNMEIIDTTRDDMRWRNRDSDETGIIDTTGNETWRSLIQQGMIWGDETGTQMKPWSLIHQEMIWGDKTGTQMKPWSLIQQGMIHGDETGTQMKQQSLIHQGLMYSVHGPLLVQSSHFWWTPDPDLRSRSSKLQVQSGSNTSTAM